MSDRVLPYLRNNLSGQFFELKGETGLGRAEDSEIVLASHRVSRNHALIVEREGRHWLRDLGSKNGTRLNGQLIQSEQLLADGDQVAVGDIHFTFGLPSPDDASTETASYLPLEASLLQVDPDKLEIRLAGQRLDVTLSSLEWKLLWLLFQNKGKVCSRDLIIQQVYQALSPEEVPFDSAIESLVSRLRKNLELRDPTRRPYLRTVRGLGYKLEV